MHTNLNTLNDEELVLLSVKGNNDAEEVIFHRYKNYVKSKARTYYLIGADNDDVVQEGMIGLYKAVRDYRDDRQASFRAFAELCVTRQIITAIKTATRQKHIPLNSYVSLNKPVFDEDSERTLEDMVTVGKAANPEELMINQEGVTDIEEAMTHLLSKLEQQVVALYLEGRSYTEIADILDRQVKSVDNALQRVKRKLENYLEKRD